MKKVAKPLSLSKLTFIEASPEVEERIHAALDELVRVLVQHEITVASKATSKQQASPQITSKVVDGY